VVRNFEADHVGSAIYHDLAASYIPNRPNLRMLDGIEFRAGVKNVFDRPPREIYSGYDLWGNPQMRAYYISIRKKL
jgi:outer membrane receptor protein involved in Fe transport